MNDELTELRKQINAVDSELTALFARRMELSERVASHKRNVGMSVRDMGREAEVIKRVSKGTRFPTETAALYRSIIDISCAKQRELLNQSGAIIGADSALFPKKRRGGIISVCAQGVQGAYSHIAALSLLNPNAPIIHKRHFAEVFEAIESEEVDYAVLPVENSSFGSVYEVYDLMREHKLKIIRALKVPARHCLLGLSGTRLANIRTVHSHRQAIGQCRNFLRRHEFEAVEEPNTAIAAKQIAEWGDKTHAALASAECAKLYGLEIISDNVSDNPNNYTRFICIGRDEEQYTDANKISFTATLPHIPGSLARLLIRFADAGLNLTKLESRPIVGCGDKKRINYNPETDIVDDQIEFMFYFDFLGNVGDPGVLELLAEVENSCLHYEFLGNYREM